MTKGKGKWWVEFMIGPKAGPFETQDEARDWIADIIQRYGVCKYKIKQAAN